MVDRMTRAERETPMGCPWWVCTAELLPVVHRTDPSDESARVLVYPIHEVVGGASWFGRCPASQLVVPFLSAAGRAVLSDATKVYLRMAGERAAAEKARRDRVAEAVHDLLDAVEDGRPVPATPPRPTPPSVEDYFPGRPADAPEPGVGDAPAAKLPLDKLAGHSQPLGKAGEMTSRETHMAMIAATLQKIGEAQEATASAILALEDLERATTVLGPHCDAASSLADATVGVLADNNMPESAIQMRVNLSLAKDTATGGDGIIQAVGLVRMRVTALVQQLAQASDAARRYQSRP
jgi:hypothetical protein